MQVKIITVKYFTVPVKRLLEHLVGVSFHICLEILSVLEVEEVQVIALFTACFQCCTLSVCIILHLIFVFPCIIIYGFY